MSKYTKCKITTQECSKLVDKASTLFYEKGEGEVISLKMGTLGTSSSPSMLLFSYRIMQSFSIIAYHG